MKIIVTSLSILFCAFTMNVTAQTAKTVCTHEWSQARNTGLGIGSLKLWAKEDNPDSFASLMLSEEL